MEDSKLKIYRQLGIDRLEQLLLQQADQPQAADRFVDQALRKLTGLPPLPEGAPPYHGIYSSAFTMEQYRDGASDRLRELLTKLPTLDPLDDEVDRQIRLLSDLPARPEGTEPYVRLFVLRDEAPDPPTVEAAAAYPPPQKQYLSASQLLEIIGSTQYRDRVAMMTPGINLTLEKFDIDTPLRISHFLGQILHESGGFRWLREIWGPSDAQRRYEPPSRLAADLGNTQTGDGKRFMGRGVIQLTGRANYMQFSKVMGIDFVAKPELVESPQYAVTAAGWFWNTRKINTLADQDDLLRVTRAINGGKNGLEDRRKYLNRAKKVLGVH